MHKAKIANFVRVYFRSTYEWSMCEMQDLVFVEGDSLRCWLCVVIRLK